MSEPKPSAWAQARLGGAAGDLARAVSRAVYQAHEQALAAHINGGLHSNDTYGITMYVALNVQLASRCEGIPGVSIRKPKDVRGRFDLVICEQPPVVLYPWRYATDRATTREQARLWPLSDLRRTLMALNDNTVDGQLTLEQGARDPEELEAELAEEEALLEQLAAKGHVVAVGLGSNTSGIFDLGWGDLELADEGTGRVVWQYWEPLAPPEDGTAGGEPQRPVGPTGGDVRGRGIRFDDAVSEDDLGLKPRPPLVEPPISEPERPQKETGSGDEQ